MSDSINIVGYVCAEDLYIFYFPTNTKECSLNEYNVKNGNKTEFNFEVELSGSMKYVLVITTNFANITGPFSISVFGPDSVNFQQRSTSNESS